jgi:hypothetical protein
MMFKVPRVDAKVTPFYLIETMYGLFNTVPYHEPTTNSTICGRSKQQSLVGLAQNYA